MHIVVLVKQVPNPEVAASQFRIDDARKAVEPVAGVALVMSPFDEQALEAALRVRDASAAARITVMTLGPESARNVLKHGLAMGADHGVLLCDAAFDAADSRGIARALAAAIRKLGSVDLVLAGRQAADDDAGVVGTGVAAILGVPVACYAQDVCVNESTLRVERVLDDGIEIVEAPLPAVVTVSNELGEPRKPNLRETMRAARKPLIAWNAADLALDAGLLRARRIVKRVYVPVKDTHCVWIEGGDAAVQAAALVERLRAARVL
jgi:electron transfer flavoprotein beta subunit